MKLTEFDYKLPQNLIASHPCSKRSASKLLRVQGKDRFQHLHFYDILDLIQPNDLIVLNTTKVIKARLYGCKPTGGKLECMIERIDHDQMAWAHIGCSKTPKTGSQIIINNTFIDIIERKNDLFHIQLPDHLNWDSFLEQYGEIPLPPYIDRQLMPEDEERYQTVFAKHAGAVAAPTAGLHFTQELLKKIEHKGVQTAEITLHVGAGTFQPVRTTHIEEHTMHHERIEVNMACINKITETKKMGGRIIAIGTTVMRALESAAQHGVLQPIKGETNLFLYPGKKIHIVDCLVTNFHLPKSSLLMLVSAFSGTETIQNAYAEAILHQYRFFSYGDAMWLNNKT